MHDDEYWDHLRLLEKIRPPRIGDSNSSISRRDFLTLLSSSIAFASASACARAPEDRIIPYAIRPEWDSHGRPMVYATSFELGGYAIGVLAESHSGRPTKIEGNPDHPASLGGTGPIEQASVLQLYDPERARKVIMSGAESSWQNLASRLRTPRTDQGAGLRIVMEPTGSPLVADLIERIIAKYPRVRIIFFSSLPDYSLEASNSIYNRPTSLIYDFTKISTAISFDSDFLDCGPFSWRYSRQWGGRRKPDERGVPGMRLYIAESELSPTGSTADDRLAVRSSEIPLLTGLLASELILNQGLRPAQMPDQVAQALTGLKEKKSRFAKWISSVASDLARGPKESSVIIGPQQRPATHVMGTVANRSLGNIGSTIFEFPDSLIDLGNSGENIDTLAEELRSGSIDTLLILNSNIAYCAPADLDMPGLLKKTQSTIYLGLYRDETAALCKTTIPAAHYLESWADSRAFDGTISMVQPLIAPLYGGITQTEVLNALSGEPLRTAHDLLQNFWRKRRGDTDFDQFWDTAVSKGIVPDSANSPIEQAVNWERVISSINELAAAASISNAIELNFRFDRRIYDGRFANNAWLLELPEPMTRQSWGNAALFAPSTAQKLGIENGSNVYLEHRNQRVKTTALIVNGHAENAITCHLGWGHLGEGLLAHGMGFNANLIRNSATPESAQNVGIALAGTSETLAIAQPHRSRYGRPIALVATSSQWLRTPDFISRHAPEKASFYPESPWAERSNQNERTGRLPVHSLTGNQWAMTIDLSLCTGCSSCVIACQAENNIPVVGKAQILRNRWMYWLRIDEYEAEIDGHPVIVRQPMLCQHCEKAPCEYVCPVNATVHSPDGLNEMVYNRCVGTRYCSNNCPYKVRRFNWFDWNDRNASNHGPFELQKNPDVTVRERGVMEKCTYCVQRLRRFGIENTLPDTEHMREIKTACQQACPTGAINFGSLTWTGSQFVQSRNDRRMYQELADQGTHPRTAYLVKIFDPKLKVQKYGE